MDLAITDELIELKERTERFVREEILPREADKRQTPHGPTEEFRRELVALARRAGLVAPHVGREWGGLGLDHRGKAGVFEAGGYSALAAHRMNIFAPHEGHMPLLGQVARGGQQGKALGPPPARGGPSRFL